MVVSRLALYGGSRRPYGSFAGKQPPANPPEDLDSDVDVTNWTDVDGATLRAPRLVIAHAADGVRNADIGNFDRLSTVDRYRARSSRESRTPNLGQRFEIHMEAVRAGEAFAVERFVLWLSDQRERPRAADTTARTDVDSATVEVPTFMARVSADSEDEADLTTTGGTVQDRWIARLPLPSSEQLDSLELEIADDGRAGNAFALERVIAWISDQRGAFPGATET